MSTKAERTARDEPKWGRDEILRQIELHGYVYAIDSVLDMEALRALEREGKIVKDKDRRGWTRYKRVEGK